MVDKIQDETPSGTPVNKTPTEIAFLVWEITKANLSWGRIRISDQAKVFVGGVFAELLSQWNIKPRFGAVGKHGSIAVNERVIKTLKYEWLKYVPLIKGFAHLTSVRTEFESWCNTWRPHMTLEGSRPDTLYYDHKPEQPSRDAKTVPSSIERHVFAETRLTAYRLRDAA